MIVQKWRRLFDQIHFTRPTLTDLNQNEIHYFLLVVSLDKCDRSFNALDDLSDSKQVPNKTEDINAKMQKYLT